MSTINTFRDLNGQLITNDIDKAEIFNNFFHSVFTVNDKQMPDFTCRNDALMKMPQFYYRRGQRRYFSLTTAEVRDAILALLPQRSETLF